MIHVSLNMNEWLRDDGVCVSSLPVDGGLVEGRECRPTLDDCERPRLQGLDQILHWDFGALRFTADIRKPV